MTNNEAINRIREHMIIHKHKEPRAIYITEALEMSIAALENQKNWNYELSQMDPYVIGAAYLYAKNYYKFGTDITEKWTTAVQQTAILERSYNNGVKDTLERLREMEKPKWIPCNERLPEVEQSVLISCRNLDVYIGFRSNTPGYYYVNGEYIDEKDVLAWMPSPKGYVISGITE